jgi:hypothetical protein
MALCLRHRRSPLCKEVCAELKVGMLDVVYGGTFPNTRAAPACLMQIVGRGVAWRI